MQGDCLGANGSAREPFWVAGVVDCRWDPDPCMLVEADIVTDALGRALLTAGILC